MIFTHITQEELIFPPNLLHSPDNLYSDPPESIYIGDINTGTLMKSAKAKECSLPNHILVPFCHVIDGLNVDTY